MVKGRLVKLQLWDTAGQDGPLKDGGFIRRWEWHGKRPHIMGNFGYEIWYEISKMGIGMTSWPHIIGEFWSHEIWYGNWPGDIRWWLLLFFFLESRWGDGSKMLGWMVDGITFWYWWYDMNSLNSALFDASIWRSCLNGTTGMEWKLRGETWRHMKIKPLTRTHHRNRRPSYMKTCRKRASKESW